MIEVAQQHDGLLLLHQNTESYDLSMDLASVCFSQEALTRVLCNPHLQQLSMTCRVLLSLNTAEQKCIHFQGLPPSFTTNSNSTWLLAGKGMMIHCVLSVPSGSGAFVPPSWGGFCPSEFVSPTPSSPSGPLVSLLQGLCVSHVRSPLQQQALTPVAATYKQHPCHTAVQCRLLSVLHMQFGSC